MLQPHQADLRGEEIKHTEPSREAGTLLEEAVYHHLEGLKHLESICQTPEERSSNKAKESSTFYSSQGTLPAIFFFFL